ncbi:MAG TPA: ATP-dependent Clp protease proteolytic subunit, partial [Phormidium sp.]
VKLFRDFIEKLKDVSTPNELLVVVLNTPGGSVEVVEKMVEIIRFHYKEVYFVVPDYAMSAGTILCMSGDKLYMDYSSSLGPIDPQVFNGKEYVLALAYLDKVEQLLDKARNNTLTQAEFLILQGQDLATLGRYEQARDLTVTLLKQWLTQYKFRTWTTHQGESPKKGKTVEEAEKEERAEEIARLLGDNKVWHSHGRMIGINTIREKLKLKVEDYSNMADLRGMIRSYNDLIIEYILRTERPFFMHSKKSF